jgi:hypothetical protein
MKTPEYFRARIAVIEHLIREVTKITQENDKARELEIRLLQNGFFPRGFYEPNLVIIMRQTRQFEDTPLKFSELTRYDTWFAMHPEKVAGNTVITTSRAFPLEVVGNENDVKETILKGMKGGNNELHERKQALKSLAEKYGFSKSDLDGLQGLGELGELLQSHISDNLLTVQHLVEKSHKEKEYGPNDTLSFDEVVKLYNDGISEDEIKAWEWYKRSLGYPMKGWDKYYLPNSGAEGETISTIRKTTIKDNHFRDITVVDEGVLLGKPTKFTNEYDGTVWRVFTALNGDKQYVSSRDIQINKTGVLTDWKHLHLLVKAGALFILNGEAVPFPIYAYGNMYDRQLELEKDKQTIIAQYGEKIYENHKAIIEGARPEMLSVSNPDARMRPKILVISDFAKEFKIKNLREDTGLDLQKSQSEDEKEYSLVEAFESWLDILPQQDFEVSTKHHITYHYIDGHKITDKDLSDEKRREIKTNARNEGEALFSRFLYEALTFEDQQKLTYLWNRTYNGQSNIAYHKIPIGFECSAKFKQFNLHFTPAQREGVAFMEAVGSGIVAYDVGVGKTMTAIISLAQAMFSGRASRPLIVVPNPTYGKWLKEIIGFVDEKTGIFVPGVLSNCGYKINAWYNLGSELRQSVKLNKQIPAGTITIVTYEGFKKIGFSKKAMEGLFVELCNILYQSQEGMSERDKEIDYQKYREVIGTGLKGTEADIDTLGIDYLVIDEAHRCKNVFDAVKADNKGRRRFGISGAVSETGLKAFFLCNYIQRTFGRNAMLLTATPFTNSPLEIYSMLSLVGYEGMKKMGINTLQNFFELFVLEQTEYAVNYKEEVVPKDVVKSFNNRLLLQKLIYNHITYKTGEEAGVKRPVKVNLPRINVVEKGQSISLTPDKQVLTYLRMTSEQRYNQNEITELAKDAARRKSMSGIFRAMARSLDNALSPFLYQGQPESYIDFVDESPKIKYTMECIRTVKQWHEQRQEQVSGQVIYMNRGKQFFPLIKEYLEKEIGYKTGVRWNGMRMDEVEIITSELSTTRKENIKEAFLSGVVKVIIGTSTIREGIDLQKCASCLYNLYPDWNPTDIRQLEGRIWRQGNMFGYVRIVMPLVQDSMDVFVFQKLEEKTSRINDIWYRGDRGNVLDLESLDPEQVKFALLTDVDALAEMKLKQLNAEIDRKIFNIEANLAALRNYETVQASFQTLKKSSEITLETVRSILLRYLENESFASSQDGKKTAEIKNRIDAYNESSDRNPRILINLLYAISNLGMFKKDNKGVIYRLEAAYSELRKTEKIILKERGQSLKGNVQELLSHLENQKTEAEREKQEINSREYFIELIHEVNDKKSAMAVSGASIEERVASFAGLNYLLSYHAEDVKDGDMSLPLHELKRERNNDDLEMRRRKLALLALKYKYSNAA